MRQRFHPDLPPAQTLRLYLRLRARQRQENTALYLIVALAFSWIIVLASIGYHLAQRT